MKFVGVRTLLTHTYSNNTISMSYKVQSSVVGRQRWWLAAARRCPATRRGPLLPFQYRIQLCLAQPGSSGKIRVNLGYPPFSGAPVFVKGRRETVAPSVPNMETGTCPCWNQHRSKSVNLLREVTRLRLFFYVISEPLKPESSFPRGQRTKEARGLPAVRSRSTQHLSPASCPLV